MSVLPRHVICVLGPENWLGTARIVLERFGQGFRFDEEYSQDEPDERMLRAFEVSYDRVAPSMTHSDWAAIDEHASVAYVLSPPLTRESAIEISGNALQLLSLLLQVGGVAAKSESAGLAHGRGEWLRLATAARAPGADATLLVRPWVRRPLVDDGEFYSCGMHLLGCPDVTCNDEEDVLAAVARIDATTQELLDGRLRSPVTTACFRYEEGDLFFNPWGYVVAGAR